MPKKLIARILQTVVVLLSTVAPNVGWADDIQKALTHIHTIGVSSNLDDQAEVRYIGITAFGNKLSYLPISEWKLNELVSSELVKNLSRRFVVKLTPIDNSAFSDTKKTFFTYNGVFNRALRTLPPTDVDAYIIVLPASEDLSTGSNQSVSGVGVYRHAGLLAGQDADEAVVHATYSIFLVDAKTRRFIQWRGGLTSSTPKPTGLEKTYAELYPRRYPRIETGEADWPVTASTLTERQTQIMHQDLVDLLKSSIGFTLAYMGLGGEADTPSDANGQ